MNRETHTCRTDSQQYVKFGRESKVDGKEGDNNNKRNRDRRWQSLSLFLRARARVLSNAQTGALKSSRTQLHRFRAFLKKLALQALKGFNFMRKRLAAGLC